MKNLLMYRSMHPHPCLWAARMHATGTSGLYKCFQFVTSRQVLVQSGQWALLGRPTCCDTATARHRDGMSCCLRLLLLSSHQQQAS